MTLDLFAPGWQEVWDGADRHEPVGAVFTRPDVVALILDLAGYVVGESRLAERRVLEPSCGEGAFVLPLLERLLASEQAAAGAVDWQDPILDGALRATDISAASVATIQGKAVRLLTTSGCPPFRAHSLAATWLRQTDFLLEHWDQSFDLVVGNPPYVRIEDLPRRVLADYRAAYSTLGDRADVYVAFIERGLGLLSPDGVLAFITANRFAKNLYGRSLRKLIAERFRVRLYLNLEHTQPFLDDVSAYPAITVIDRKRGGPTRAASLSSLDSGVLDAVRADAASPGPPLHTLSEFPRWYPDGAPWITTCHTEHSALTRLSRRLTLLEQSAPETRVGIGVATGADRVFILPGFDATIEKDRQIPLLMGRDVSNEELRWSRRYLIDPFARGDQGGLVDLADYPGLAAYLLSHEQQLLGRHVAKSRPAAWFRTIDRIWPHLRHTPKLVIPDIQPPDHTTVGLDTGEFYPHHNLYWITSAAWPLPALKALLRSTAVRDQVRAFSVQMRGGSLRWQAQTLRRLHVPALRSLPDVLLEELVRLSTSPDQAEIDAVADEAFAHG